MINHKVRTFPDEGDNLSNQEASDSDNDMTGSHTDSRLDENARLMKLATTASITTAVVLILAKLVAWFMTGSLSVLATLLDSAMDAVASIITLIAVRIAVSPADAEHRFGHGKAEYLSVLVQSAFIAGSAIVLFLNALDRLKGADPALGNETVGIVVMLISIVATLILLAIQRYVVRKTNSSAIAADSMHYKVDLLTNSVVILALLGSSLGYKQLDSILTLAIAVYMLSSVYSMARQAIDHLMDHSMPEEEVEKIQNLAMSVPGIIGVHEIRTRISGQVSFIQMHLDLDGELPLKTAHDIGFAAKKAVLDYMPDADIIVHLDPEEKTP
ncbi:MAG: cation diffusion facilitator family transporter [Endozoicomonas sp.]